MLISNGDYMDCEICGRSFSGKGVKIFLEGAELTVCLNCSKLGYKKEGKPQEPVYPVAKTIKPPRKRSEIPTYELIDDYAQKIKQAREKMGLDRKQLGLKIAEKETFLARIESGAAKPDEALARRLEKFLEIKLLEREEKEEIKLQHRADLGITIGDIIDEIKTKKKDKK
jgi:putative transcription factor